MSLRKLRVELTKHCLLRCKHCSAFAGPNNFKQIPFFRMEELLKEFHDMGGSEVTLTGGEPFLYGGISSLFNIAADLDIDIVMFSSGVVEHGNGFQSLNENTFENFKKLPSKIVFSLYSSIAEEHEQLTLIKGSFKSTIESIENCNKLGIATELHFVLTKNNLETLPSLVELSERLGCRSIRIIRYVPHGRGKQNKDLLQPGHNEMFELQKMVRELTPRTSVELKLGSGFGIVAPDIAGKCTAAIDEIVIDIEGNVFPCSAFTNIRIDDSNNNIFTSTLSQVFDRSLLMNQVRNALAARKSCACSSDGEYGCLAQKSIMAGYVTDSILDPDQINRGQEGNDGT